MSQKRMEFVVRAAAQREPMRRLCREFQISPETGYKWLNRYREAGQLAGVQERSRRPLHTPGKTAAEIEERVVELRRQYPDWGAKKLRVLLAEEGVPLPVITIHRILLRNHLVWEAERRRPALRRFERNRPNELWQMDYKGVPAAISPWMIPLAIIDDHSRYLTALAPLPGTGAGPLLELLAQVFGACGVPEAMLVDHGTPWWNAQSRWGLTRVSLWLMKQDIELIHGAIRHPQTQGKVEASNRAIQRQLRVRGWPGRGDWREWLERFRLEWNYRRPHEALQMATPASRWRPSALAYQREPRQYDYSTDAVIRRVAEHGQFHYAGRVFCGPAALAGEDVAISHLAADRYVVRSRRTLIREIDVATGQSWPLPFQPYRDLFSDEPETPPSL